MESALVCGIDNHSCKQVLTIWCRLTQTNAVRATTSLCEKSQIPALPALVEFENDVVNKKLNKDKSYLYFVEFTCSISTWVYGV